MLATDLVGYPAEERLRQTSEHPVEPHGKLQAGSVQKRIVTGAAPISKSRMRSECNPNATRAPVPTMTNIAYMTQNVGAFSTSPGVKSRFVC